MKATALVGVALGLFSAPLWACQTFDNLVPNCGFTSNTIGWENETAGVCVHNTSNGASAVGNITCTSLSGAISHVVRFRRCLPTANGVNGGYLYRYGAFAQQVTGNNVSCTVEAADFTSDNCQFNVNAVTTFLGGAAPPNYAQSVAASYELAPLAVSAHVRIACTGPSAFQVRVDDVFFREETIFKNGFQTPL